MTRNGAKKMSTVGAGVAVTGAGAAGGVVIIPLLAVAAVGVAAIGTGVLIAKGVMWCGDKMEENYQSACQQWANLAEVARAENLANVEQMSTQLTSRLEHLSASAYEFVDTTSQGSINSIDQQALFATIARTRVAINDAQLVAQQDDTERELFSARLRAEIKNGRGILPAQVLAEAEQALQNTVPMMQQALKTIEEAWNNVTEQSSRRTHMIQQAQQIAIIVSTQLNAIDTMLREIGSSGRVLYRDQQRQLEKKVRDAQDQLEAHPARALEQIRTARQEVKVLLEEVSLLSLDALKQVRRQVNAQIGILAALETMVKEAEAITLVKKQTLASLADRVTKALDEARRLQDAPDVQKQLMLLTQRTALLKEDIFREVKKSQQQNIAEIIQNTLEELDFHSEENVAPAISINGDVTRVEILLSGLTETGGRNDRTITFDISRDGQVNYDFAGYSGNTCMGDVQMVFGALRKKGLFLLDDAVLEKLQRTENFTSETLKKEEFQPYLIQNKTQAELAESLKNVLEDMGYAKMHQSVVGGFIELEAFNGPLGYSIVLSPEGEAQVFKDANRVDVSHDENDVIVEHVQKIQDEKPEPQKKPRTSYMKSRKQQMLDH
jgi:hypothetical protein